MNVSETDRLILRQITVDDAEYLYRIYNDPLNMEFMGTAPDSIEIERFNIQKHIADYYEKYGFGLWATILKENNQLIGRCGLLYQEIEGGKELEIAYLIEHKFWGKGLATEASRAVLELAFEKYNFERVVALINPKNVASVRVAGKIGMKYEREVAYKDFGDVSLYAIEI
jgi:[ribosomal protein S5]-alanine N-acetyltransferase